MKLADVKERIDKYFEEISAEELYEISISKYGFTEIIYEIEGYYQKISNSIPNNKDENFSVSGKKDKIMDNLLLAA